MIEFYKDLIKSVGLVITEDGYIKTGTGVDDNIITVDKKPLVLPYKEHIDSMVEVIDGQPESIKVLFNPLKEDVIKGEPASLRKFKTILENKLGFTTAIVIELLLRVADDKELQKKASLRVNNFVSSLSSVIKNKRSTAVDAKSVSNWVKIWSSSIDKKSTDSVLHIYLKKGGVIQGEKYNRVAFTTFGIYELLEKMDKKHNTIHGVKLRTKDIEVYKLVYDYIFEDIDTEIGSNDDMAAGLVVTVKTMITISNRLNKLLKDLKFIDEEIYDIARLPNRITYKTIDNIKMFKADVVLIPSDGDTFRKSKRRPKRAVQKKSLSNKSTGSLNTLMRRNATDNNVREPEQIEPVPNKREVVDREPSGGSPLSRLLGTNNRVNDRREPIYDNNYKDLPPLVSQRDNREVYRSPTGERLIPIREERQRPESRPMGINSRQPVQRGYNDYNNNRGLVPIHNNRQPAYNSYNTAYNGNQNLTPVNGRRDNFGNYIDEYGVIIQSNPNIRR